MWNSIDIRRSLMTPVFSYKLYLELKIEPLKVLNQLRNAVKMKIMNLMK